MAVAATIGWHSEFWLESAGPTPVLTKLECPTEIGFPGIEVEEVEVTCYDSPDRTREYISGLKTPGDFEVTFMWEPGNATDDILLAALGDGVARGFKIGFGVVAGVPTQQVTGDCIVRNYEPSVPIDEAITLTVTFKLASALTWGAYV